MPDEMAPSGPLADLRVLDLTDATGSYCGKLFADLGADVVKVEPPAGDAARRRGPFARGEVHPERSLAWWQYNASKRGITLNLHSADGRALFRRLLASADIVLETTMPGTLEALGIGYPRFQAAFPRLIWTAITPFGQEGPRARDQGPDLVVFASSGLMNLTGEPDGPPVRLGGQQSHNLAGIYAALGTMAAVMSRLATGQGQYLDVSRQAALATAQADGGATFYQFNQMIPGRVGSEHPVVIPIKVVPCQDGYIFGGALMPHEWRGFRDWMAELTEVEELLDPALDSPPNRIPFRDLIHAVFANVASAFTKQAMYEEAQRRRLPFAPVSDVRDLWDNPQLRARGWFQDVEHPDRGETVTYPGAPYRLTRTPWRITRPAPHIGQHNAEIYGELGLTGADLARLRGAGAI